MITRDEGTGVHVKPLLARNKKRVLLFASETPLQILEVVDVFADE
jgi:hypothetical protein